ncbi:MAG: peptidoglycan DD-metalloendopeptidase family protein [Myxococcales bacterium]|nr:peptidoglycan DD-metalloendopeptidase family protein [Myxococcales bacterium]
MIALLFASAHAAPQYAWPTTAGAWITAHFDDNGSAYGALDYTCGVRSYDGHKGTDIGSGRGAPVRAAAGGRVVEVMDGFGDGYVGNYSQGYGFGNHVVIDHGDGDMTIYGHMSAWSGLPAPWSTVRCGDAIGAVGTSGNSSGPHLHFETRVNTDGSYLFSGYADDPFAGACSGPVSFWNDQAGGTPTTACADGTVPTPDACDGHANGEWCDGDDLITCSGGREVARDGCSWGCESMPVGVPDQCYAAPADTCDGKVDGLWCDGDDLVECRAGDVWTRQACASGCESMPFGTPDQCSAAPTFCDGLMDGLWCDGDDLVTCSGDRETDRDTCSNGCQSMPLGTPDQCAPSSNGNCLQTPPEASPTAPTTSCNWMDWEMSPDGYYLISRFGADTDPTTWGHTTTCGYLQSHYDAMGCVYDAQSGRCLPGTTQIPWIQGHVDYSSQAMFDANDRAWPGDVPHPEYFYVAGAQRFGCGATLRVTNPANGSCVVVYAEDGGPGATFEGPAYGGRRILDASPAVSDYLGIQHWGWANSDMVYVELGEPGDVPGHACDEVCGARPAADGAPISPWDPNHMQWSLDCR